MPKIYNSIVFDDIEQRYIGLYGESYKTIEDIPKKYHNLVQPIKPIMKIKTTIASNQRKFFVIDVYPNNKNTSVGTVIVKPYNHDANLQLQYEIRKEDTRTTYNKKTNK